MRSALALWSIRVMKYLILVALLAGCFPAEPSACPVDALPDSGTESRPDAGQGKADATNSPAWQVPVNLPAGIEIADYGVIEYDNRERVLSIRIVGAGAQGPDVLHGPVSVTAPAGEVTVGAGMSSPMYTPDRPLLVQVWRPNIGINNGRLIGVWVDTDLGRIHFSAIAGRGAGIVQYMNPQVDWTEP